MKAEFNLAFSYSLLGRTDMTDTLRGENIGKKKKHVKFPSSQSQHLNPCCLPLQKPAAVGWEALSLTLPRA